MEKIELKKQFVSKLTYFMCERGYNSERTAGGVNIGILASIADCSYQMARKYAIGEVLPDLSIIIKIANHLNCHPAQLLFDDVPLQNIPINNAVDLVAINKPLLKYILNKSLALLSLSHDSEDIINFVVGIIYDVSHLDVNTETLHKIIDMMISSATLLNKTVQDEKICVN